MSQTCGNDLIEGTEQCDGTEFAGRTCATVSGGFVAGTLACSAQCTFDTSGCTTETSGCGDGVIDEDEDCDGEALGEATCESLGDFTGGTLACSAQCTFDTSACVNETSWCGDGVIDEGEDCDGENLGGATCEGLGGFAGGSLDCTEACILDTSACLVSGDLVITEMMIHPGGSVGSAGQWIEVYNASLVAIHLGGLRIGSDGDATHIIEPSVAPTVPAGGYAVFGLNGAVAANGGVTLDYVYSGISLHLDADRIGLYGASGGVIDEVHYDAAAGWAVTEGASLQLDGSLPPSAVQNDHFSRWCASMDAYGTAGLLGTPRQANVDCEVPPDNVFFSEYVEGTSNNKALELYNGGQTTVALGDCRVRVYSNGSAAVSLVAPLSAVSLPPGGIFVVCHTSAGTALAPYCDQLHGNINYSGNDAVELFCDGVAMDVIGQIGHNPGTAWGTAPTRTQDQTLRRKCSVTVGDPDGSDPFDPAMEWDGFAVDTFDGLGVHCPG